MEDIRYDSRIGLKINNLGFISVVRKKNFSFAADKGKENFSFVFVMKGKMKYNFQGFDESFVITEGEMLYIPRRIPYKAEYTESNTTIKTITFDVAEEDLPSYISTVPTKKSSKKAWLCLLRSLVNS